jgi:uncharacterized SAM-binding protein YcdF (DUF218 family)
VIKSDVMKQNLSLEHESPPSPASERPLFSRQLTRLAILVVLLGVLLFLLSRAGSFLVVDDPQPSDAIVILAGSGDTPGYARTLELHRQGYAPNVFLDAGINPGIYGRSEQDLAREYLYRTGDRVTEICSIYGGTTEEEVVDVQHCLQRVGARSAILITTDFATRRVLDVFRKRLPQYRWSVAAASSPYHFAEQYWKHRGWAKTVLQEWEDYLWWKLVDQWRSGMRLQ